MKKTLSIFALLIFGASISTTSYACSFHDGYDAPSPYGWVLRTYDNNDPALAEIPTVKEKPVFSTAASSASEFAKSKVNNEKVQEQSKQQDDSVKQTSDEEVESKASL